MRRKTSLCLWLFVSALLLLPVSMAEAQKPSVLIGRETVNFTLASTNHQTINYADEYYGKYHLVLTFFPAAFTPI